MFGFFNKQDQVPDISEEELNIFRGKTWDDYLGQEKLKEKLKIAIQAAKERNDIVLPHCLLSSGPGQGKTTVAQIIANEFGAKCKTYISTAIESAADIIEVCTKAEPGSIQFLDESHALPKSVQTILLSVLEDNKITLKLGKNIAHIPLNKFTIIAATTDMSKMLEPLRNRFGISHVFDPYTRDELAEIIRRSSEKVNFPIHDQNILLEVAKRSRGTPRNCNRLILRIRDFCQVKNNGRVDIDAVNEALALEGINEDGLNRKDMQYIQVLYSNFGGGPAGCMSIASAMGETKEFLSNDIEPFLLSEGFINRTSRGRVLTQKSIDLINGL